MVRAKEWNPFMLVHSLLVYGLLVNNFHIDYRHQDDEQVASRGSISMKSAVLKYSAPTDKLRFEIDSSPGRGQQKWYIKGSHAVEVGRWTQAIARSIELARRDGNGQTQSGSESESLSLRNFGSSLRSSISSRRPTKNSAPSIHDSIDDSGIGPSEDEGREVGGAYIDEGDDDQEDDDSSDALSQRAPPHESEYTLHGNSTAAQVEMTAQLLVSFVLPPNAPRDLHDLRAALEESAQTASRMVGDLVRMSAEREEWWREQVNRERARGALWEESLQVVVQEGAVLEEELKNRARGSNRRSSRVTEDISRRASTDLGRSTIRMRGSMQSGILSPPPFQLEQPPASVSGLPIPSPAELPGGDINPLSVSSTSLPAPVMEDSEEMVDTDEEDEFFDAIDANNLPNVVIPDALVKSPPLDAGSLVELDQYEGYKHLREKLPMEKDTRPPTSLWSVLKHSIGKDLTKISFPVFFNEPTSMLQRMVSMLNSDLNS